MFFQGIHNNQVLPNINEELGKLEGYLTEEEGRIALAKFLRYNPYFAIQLMTGKKVYPFQEMIIRAMFNKDFFLAIMGRGFSKTWTASMFAWLYAVMEPGAKIGIISKTFRQARFIFTHIEEFANSREGTLLAQCFGRKPSHKNDIWDMEIGESQIVALPLGEGGKLRGFRFNVILIDELLLMPANIVNEVILPFIAVNFDPVKRTETELAENSLIAKGLMKEEDRTVFSNPKFIGLSSASYKFEFLYQLYEEYYSKITSPESKDDKGNIINTKGYGIIHLSYLVAPVHIYNEDTLAKFKAQFSESQFQREFGAIFTDDSGGFFSKRKMDLCTIEGGKEPTIEIAGDKKAKYILAIDPSFSKSESSDHYAMSLFKLIEDKRQVVLVHNYAIAGGQLQDHMRYFSYLLRYFNIVYVIIDNAGHWFIDECNASVIFSEHNLKVSFFEADFENSNYMEGLRISQDSYNPLSRNICHAQKFAPDWIRLANERLAAAFDHQTIWFAAPAMGERYELLKKLDISLDELVYDNQGEDLEGMAKKADFIEHQTDLIDLVKSETALIEIKSAPSGHQTFQLPQSLRRSDSPDRARKDNYTTLLLGNWGAKCYYDLVYTDLEVKGFTPFFIV